MQQVRIHYLLNWGRSLKINYTIVPIKYRSFSEIVTLILKVCVITVTAWCLEAKAFANNLFWGSTHNQALNSLAVYWRL